MWAQGVLFGLKSVVGLGYIERGRQNVPDEPCLITCNHQSTWETIAALTLFPDVAIIAKEELLSIPVFGWYLRKSPMIIIDREGRSKALRSMADGARTALASGRSVLIFPEGTRKRVGDLVEFKRGIEFLYSKLDAVVLPMAVNSGTFWAPDRPIKRGGTIVVSYLPPIRPGLDASTLTSMLENLLEAEKPGLVSSAPGNG